MHAFVAQFHYGKRSKRKTKEIDLSAQVAIGDICSFAKGASVPRVRMRDTGDFIYIHYGDLYKGHDLYVDVENPQTPLPYISQKEHVQEDQFLKDNDIVYVLTSETVDDLGKALLLKNPENRRVVSGTETTIVHVNRTDLVLPAYLNYMFQTKYFHKVLQQYATGMKVFRVHPRDISRILIDLPSLDTQNRIVKMLDEINDKIRLNARINDYLAA